MCETVEVTDDF